VVQVSLAQELLSDLISRSTISGEVVRDVDNYESKKDEATDCRALPFNGAMSANRVCVPRQPWRLISLKVATDSEH
jgi:hypothetical protein